MIIKANCCVMLALRYSEFKEFKEFKDMITFQTLYLS